jgi:predicted transposase/invertase (TIGR01784 family)
MDVVMDIVSEEGVSLLKPSSDFVFRNVFGTDERKSELISLLNAILKGKPHINDLTIENGDMPKDMENGKSVRLDIRAVVDGSTKILIEIQCYDGGSIINRSDFYQALQLPEELHEGQSFDSLPNIISIWFTTYNETKRKYHTSEAVLMYKESELDPVEIASEKFRTIIIELKKVDLSKAKASDILDAWMYFLIAPEEIPDEFLKVKEVNEAMQTLTYVSHDPEKRRIYNARIRAQNDIVNAMSHAKNEGRAEGRAEGRTEREREMARNAIQMGMPMNQVSQLTGLSDKELRSL